MSDNRPLKDRVLALCIPVTESGCWLWLSCTRPNGYGTLKYKNRRVAAHRASYTAFKGPIPSGMCVCHKCDTKSCVNPDHLYAGTHKDNRRDALLRLRTNIPWGEQHHACKLTDADVKYIRESEESTSELMKRFDVTQPTISEIKNFKTRRRPTPNTPKEAERK